MPSGLQDGSIIVGEAHCDAEGGVHGWCWMPEAPTLRIKVELLINGAVVRSVIASRFREDLRERCIGDGYHAFSLPMPPEVFPKGCGAHAALRAAETSVVFWQMNALTRGVGDDLAVKLTDTRTAIHAIAGGLSLLERRNQTKILALEFKALATRIRAAVGLSS